VLNQGEEIFLNVYNILTKTITITKLISPPFYFLECLTAISTVILLLNVLNNAELLFHLFHLFVRVNSRIMNAFKLFDKRVKCFLNVSRAGTFWYLISPSWRQVLLQTFVGVLR